MPEYQPTSEWTGWRGRIGARYLSGPMRKLEDRWFLGSPAFLGGVFAVLRGGETVLDVGAGSGYCSLEIAERLGTGEVICLDLSDEMLDHLETRARRRGLRERIRILKADACSSGLGEGSVDLAVSAGVFHELPEPGLALAEMRRVLKPDGWAMVLDFRATWFGRLVAGTHRGEAHGPFNEEELGRLFLTAGFQNAQVAPVKHALIGRGQR